MLSTLQAVLDNAQADHVYVSDQALHGVAERWGVGLLGDCEDFALWCRAALQARGIASDLVLCRTERGEGHLVCSVEGYILDNRHAWVMRRDDLAYEWISLGAPDGTWKEITA